MELAFIFSVLLLIGFDKNSAPVRIFLIVLVAIQDPIFGAINYTYGHFECLVAKREMSLATVVEQVEEPELGCLFTHKKLVDVIMACRPLWFSCQMARIQH